MSEADQKLKEGIVALKEGHKEQARALLTNAIRLAPSEWKAWLWLSRAVDDETEQRRCLKRALEINPKSKLVQKELEELGMVLPPADQVPDHESSSQSASIWSEMLLEEREQTAMLRKLHQQQDQLQQSVKTIKSAAQVWLILVVMGIILACIGVVVGNPFAF